MTADDTRAAAIDRAIFTAIRSPMGSGYRIVSATGGLSADEQRGIVRCGPAHGSLCEDSPTASGLASFTLDSGRQCLLLARHAGPEQTARGGYRVLTHALVLEPDVFARFGWDPLEIERAALAALGPSLLDAPTSRLDPLALRYPRGLLVRRQRRPESADPNHVERLARIVAAILAAHPTVVLGVPLPRDLLRCALLLTPAIRRRDLSLSCGLRPSSARPFQFVLADGTPGEIGRIRSDQQINVWNWDEQIPPDETNAPWIRFLRQGILAGRFEDVARLASEVVADGSPEALAGTLRLVDDIARAAEADADTLDRLTETYLQSAPPSGALPHLLDDLRLALVSRRAALAQESPEPEPEAAAAATPPSGQDD